MLNLNQKLCFNLTIRIKRLETHPTSNQFTKSFTLINITTICKRAVMVFHKYLWDCGDHYTP